MLAVRIQAIDGTRTFTLLDSQLCRPLPSPTNFEIDDYKITKDITLVLEIEKDESGDATATCNPEDIRIGTELEIKGGTTNQPVI